MRLQELLGVVVTLAGLAGIPLWVASHQAALEPADRRVIRLTGVMKDGAWTTEPVSGLNYGLKRFRPAVIHLRLGERVVLRLTSADVTHGFAIPELGIAAVDVKPGEVKDILLDATRAGVFTYYCSTVCGSCHYFMRGVIHVDAGTGEALERHVIPCPHHGAHPDNRTGQLRELVAGLGRVGAPGDAAAVLMERGRTLFLQKGCVQCHRQLEGEAVAALPPDVAAIVSDPRFCPYQRFLARYEPARIARKEPGGAEPTIPERVRGLVLFDPGLTQEEADALAAYLLTSFTWGGASP